jgi:hypothetical protein
VLTVLDPPMLANGVAQQGLRTDFATEVRTL